MRYTTTPINTCGIRFKLEEGNVAELYSIITHSVEEFLKDLNQKIKIPSTPKFNELETKVNNILNPIYVKRVEHNPGLNGYISVNYFKTGKNIKADPNIDYPTSLLFSGGGFQTTNESITFFFNTNPQSLTKKEDKAWVNQEYRDMFLKYLGR